MSQAENCLTILKISLSIRSDGKQVAERRERYVTYERLIECDTRAIQRSDDLDAFGAIWGNWNDATRAT